jgi:hypothetical protein
MSQQHRRRELREVHGVESGRRQQQRGRSVENAYWTWNYPRHAKTPTCTELGSVHEHARTMACWGIDQLPQNLLLYL